MSNPPSDQRKSLTSKTRPLHGHPTSSLPVKRAVSKSRRYGSITEIQGFLAIPPPPTPFNQHNKAWDFLCQPHQKHRTTQEAEQSKVSWIGYKFGSTQLNLFWIGYRSCFWYILGASDMEFLFSWATPGGTMPDRHQHTTNADARS